MSNKKLSDFFDSITDILNFADPIDLVKGLLFQNMLALFAGPSGKGKTFIIIDLLLSIATGRKFLDQFEVAEGNVLYCYGEGGFGLKKRVKAWLTHKGVSKDDVKFLSTRSVLNLSKRDEVESFIRTLLMFPDYVASLKVIAFDTLARCTVGSEENSNSAMGVVIENVDLIREKLGVTVLIVHHTGKDENKGERGASALRGAMDTVFELKGKGTKSSVSLEMTKQKDDEEADTLNLQFHSIDIGNGKQSIVPYLSSISQPSAANDNLPEKSRFLFNLIASFGDDGVSDKELRDKWKETEWAGRKSNFADAKKPLMKDGYIDFDDKNKIYHVIDCESEEEQTEQTP